MGVWTARTGQQVAKAGRKYLVAESPVDQPPFTTYLQVIFVPHETIIFPPIIDDLYRERVSVWDDLFKLSKSISRLHKHLSFVVQVGRKEIVAVLTSHSFKPALHTGGCKVLLRQLKISFALHRQYRVMRVRII